TCAAEVQARALAAAGYIRKPAFCVTRVPTRGMRVWLWDERGSRVKTRQRLVQCGDQAAMALRQENKIGVGNLFALSRSALLFFIQGLRILGADGPGAPERGEPVVAQWNRHALACLPQ